MKRLNILLLGVGGNVTQGILAALRSTNNNYNIIGACVSKESIGLYMCDKAYICPNANDIKFMQWVIDVCNKEEIDIVFSGVEEVIFEMAKNIEIFKTSTKSIFISSSYEQLLIGNDKYKTSIWLKEQGLNYPAFSPADNTIELDKLIKEEGYPLLAKPKSGKGSSGILIINELEDFDQINNKEEYIIQQYLGDEDSEYTVGCYCDKNGKLQDIIIMKRKLKYGTTFFAEIVQDEVIEQECKNICRKFKPIGPLNIQLRKHKGKAVCFELNVRFSGTTPLRSRWGYNDVEAMIREYIFNENIDGYLKPLKQAKAYRYFNEFYIDLDMENKLECERYIENVSLYDNREEKRIY